MGRPGHRTVRVTTAVPCASLAPLLTSALASPLAITADDLGEAAFGHLLVARLHEEKIDSLTGLIHGARVRVPLTFDRDGCLIHSPAEPYRPLAAVDRRFGLKALGIATDLAVFDEHYLFVRGGPLRAAPAL